MGEVGQTFGDDGHVARADLEKAVTAEGAAGPHWRFCGWVRITGEVLIGALQNAAVAVICRRSSRHAEW